MSPLDINTAQVNQCFTANNTAGLHRLSFDWFTIASLIGHTSLCALVLIISGSEVIHILWSALGHNSVKDVYKSGIYVSENSHVSENKFVGIFTYM